MENPPASENSIFTSFSYDTKRHCPEYNRLQREFPLRKQKDILAPPMPLINDNCLHHLAILLDKPFDVLKILMTEDSDADPYAECRRLVSELEKIGWTAEWGLDGILYDLKQINQI
mgnify:CR=1 FL=1